MSTCYLTKRQVPLFHTLWKNYNFITVYTVCWLCLLYLMIRNCWNAKMAPSMRSSRNPSAHNRTPRGSQYSWCNNITSLLLPFLPHNYFCQFYDKWNIHFGVDSEMLMIIKPLSSIQIIASGFWVTVCDINMYNTTGIIHT